MLPRVFNARIFSKALVTLKMPKRPMLKPEQSYPFRSWGTLPMDSALEKMLRFIDDYQRQHSHKSSMTLVRELRAYTRASYANKFWELVAGSNPDFVTGELDNQTVMISGKAIDFAHFMAALSDQAWGGNLFSVLVDGFLWASSRIVRGRGYDSREYTAAIGDTAQPIEIYLDKYGPQQHRAAELGEMLQKFASDQDYDSDIVAYLVGRFLYEQPELSIKDAILKADQLPFLTGVQQYLTEMFGADIHPEAGVQNWEMVLKRICDRIRTYLLIKRDLIKTDLLNRTYWKQVRPALIEQSAQHFVNYFQRSLST
jgi:hypothetical protein